MTARSLLRIVGAVAVVVVLFGGVSYFRAYAEARGEVRRLEVERAGLLRTARDLNSDRDSLLAANDTIGQALDSVNAVADSVAEELGNQAVEIVERIVEVVPPEIAVQIIRADSLRVAQVDSANARADRAEDVAARSRRALLTERVSHEEIVANVRDQLRNAELRVAAFQRIAETGWVENLFDNSKWVGVGAFAGAVGCYLFCPAR